MTVASITRWIHYTLTYPVHILTILLSLDANSMDLYATSSKPYIKVLHQTLTLGIVQMFS